MKKTKAKTCNECRGVHYILMNESGKVHGEVCSCFECELCNGRGMVFSEDEKGISFLSPCVCDELKENLSRLNQSGIPGKFVNAQFETFHPMDASQKLALKIAKDFVKDFGKTDQGILFMGRPGLGKTHLAVSILKQLIFEKDAECKFVDFFQLLSDIRFGYSQDLSEQAIINPYVHAPVLVIDELAKGRNTEWELTMLDQIISSRYNSSDKVTLFTTNFLNEIPNTKESSKCDTHVEINVRSSRKTFAGEETLEDKVGERIYSRLTEMCRFVKIEGEDYRHHVRTHSPGSRSSPIGKAKSKSKMKSKTKK